MSDSVNPPVVLDPEAQLDQETRDIQNRFGSICSACCGRNGAVKEATILIDIDMAVKALRPNRRERFYSSVMALFFLTIMKYLAERTVHPNVSEETFIQQNFVAVSVLLQESRFRSSSEFLRYVLKWLENRWVIVLTGYHRFYKDSPQFVAHLCGSRFIRILNNLLVCDTERIHEARILKLSWNHTDGVREHELLRWLSRIATHYSPDIHEAGSEEKFIKYDEDRALFLQACSIADTDNTSFHTDVNGALNQAEAYGQIARRWAEEEENLHTNASSCKLANVLSIDFTKTARLNTAKMCLDRLDFAKKISADLNSYKSDTFASVMDNVMSPELTSLNALKKESKLRKEVVHQVEKISEKHRQAYEAVKKQQYERLEEIFQASQKEVEDVVREALYKKEKYMASVAKESISSAVNLTSEDVLKRIVEQTGDALKTAEDKLEVHRLEKARNSECAVCFMEFTKKRKRACLDPCGHVNACFTCATKAWETKPNCPLCRVPIEKPIPLPAQLFF